MAVLTSLSPGSHGGPVGDTWRDPRGKGTRGGIQEGGFVRGPRGRYAGDTWCNREVEGRCGDIHNLDPTAVPHGSKAGDERVRIEWPLLGEVCGEAGSSHISSPRGEEGLGFQSTSFLSPAASKSLDRFLCHLWKRESKSENIRGDLRSFAQVLRSKPAPVVMVGGRDRGWARDGFGAGRHGRGAGRSGARQDFTWRRQEWARKEMNADKGEEIPDRDR